jgi:type IV secretion system protein VirB5
MSAPFGGPRHRPAELARACDFITDKGARAQRLWRANDPFAKVEIQVAVDISSVIRASNDSFRVACERRYENASLPPPSGGPPSSPSCSTPRTTPNGCARTPRVFVHANNWSKELG